MIAQDSFNNDIKNFITIAQSISKEEIKKETYPKHVRLFYLC